MLAKDTKPGAIIKQNEAPLIIESVMVQSPSARGGATLYKFRARNLVTKQKVDLSCKGTDNLEEADFQRREATFMFADAEQIHFLDQEDYNQWSLLAADIEEEMQYVTEELQGILGIGLRRAMRGHPASCDRGVEDHRMRSRRERQLCDLS